MLHTFCFEREVDHHDGILLHDTDQQDDADQGYDAEIVAGNQQRENCADTGRGQRGENREGMNVALVEHSEHDVNGDDGGQNEPGLARKRIVKGSRGSLKTGIDAAGQADLLFRLFDRRGGLTQGNSGSKVERQVHHGKLAQVIDRKRCIAHLDASEGGKRNLRGVGGCGGRRVASRGVTSRRVAGRRGGAGGARRRRAGAGCAAR